MAKLLALVAAVSGVLFIGGVGVLALAAVLANTGGPAAASAGCRPAAGGEARAVRFDAEEAASFQQKWDELQSALDAGDTAFSMVFSESEVSSRAGQYLEERNAPLGDIIVCFHEGEVEARAKAEFPGLTDIPLIGSLFDSDIEVRGEADLSGEHPRIKIHQMKAGNLPGLVSDEIQSEVEDAVNERLEDLTLRHHYNVAFREGEAQVTVAP